jgi:hypothetical protein
MHDGHGYPDEAKKMLGLARLLVSELRLVKELL